jgi:hypothetical protein
MDPISRVVFAISFPDSIFVFGGKAQRNREESGGIGTNQEESGGIGRNQEESGRIRRNREESGGIERNREELKRGREERRWAVLARPPGRRETGP